MLSSVMAPVMAASPLQEVATVGLAHYLVLAAVLFCIGLYGLLSSRNAIRALMGLELMLSAVTLNWVALNNFMFLDYLYGQVFAIFILTVSAAEAAVGLAIVMALYRQKASVDLESYSLLKW